MRARSFSRAFIACAAACVAVAVAAACSTFSGDPPLTEEVGSAAVESGSDAASAVESGSDAASGIDAALAPTPGKVDCFVSTCDITMNQTCCVDVDGGPTQCAPSCGFGVVHVKCDESADCAPGDICCVGFFGNVDCQKTCSGDRLCHADSECEVGSSCVKTPCRGTVIGVCGPVSATVKKFCADDHDQ